MTSNEDFEAAFEAEEAEFQRESVKRLGAFSDAVFAIAMTLMVLDLNHPEPSQITSDAALSKALKQWSHYEAFILSFAVIAVYWQAHFRAFRKMKRVDSPMLLLNLALLMAVTFVPFPTSVLEDFRDSSPAIRLYAGTLAALGFVWGALWGYGVWRGLIPLSTHLRLPQLMAQMLVPPLVFAASVPITWIDNAWAVRSWLLILVGELFGPRIRDRAER